ncbi:hypothetical protein [Actinomadura bangladeshensis]|uniref:Uncharacterized protein n=1 Tax=Actinomadura bangladeshensis TaxID=453573 RepID=A0A6L9QEJ7_9ACTN|nr:hypothetical protein [Actinomadura bangladeshensis]NEA23436.1 hypothetical protein [Actinomadura bangladeshensis]NED59111.1 hypothetical protein [Micromonospora aurantiaca]
MTEGRDQRIDDYSQSTLIPHLPLWSLGCEGCAICTVFAADLADQVILEKPLIGSRQFASKTAKLNSPHGVVNMMAVAL